MLLTDVIENTYTVTEKMLFESSSPDQVAFYINTSPI